MNAQTRYVPGNALEVGDVLVNPNGDDFTVTKITHIGHGVRVFYPGSTGKPRSFTIPTDGLARVVTTGSLEQIPA
jgi:hypothetical protein